MPFSTPLPLPALVSLCRSFRHSLSAGLDLTYAVDQQAKKGPPSARPVLTRVAERLKTGDSLEDALAPDADKFPPLFRAMAAVGEQSGTLPDIFGDLEKYFSMLVTLGKQFRADIRWPVFQLVAAQFVIAGLIFILGFLQNNGRGGYDPLGWGLLGTRGAIIYLAIVGGIAFAGYAVYNRTRAALGSGRATLDRTLLKLPVVGPALESLTLARFCLGLKLTLGAGLGVRKALTLSLEAARNGAYSQAAELAAPTIRKGRALHDVLVSCGLFPEEFLHIVETAEEAGRLPESMGQQAEHHMEEAHFRLKRLAQVSGYLIYFGIAVFLITMIFRLYSSVLSVPMGI